MEKDPQQENGGGAQEDEAEDEDENKIWWIGLPLVENFMQGSLNLQVKEI